MAAFRARRSLGIRSSPSSNGFRSLAVKGPLGELARTYPVEVKLTRDDSSGKLLVARAVDTRRARQMHGLFRTLTDNMIIGVSKGFEKKLYKEVEPPEPYKGKGIKYQDEVIRRKVGKVGKKK
ncbi:unnamed protein product [Calypogeia fissa]